MSTRIYVGNLGPGLTRHDVFRIFRAHGSVESISMTEPTSGDGKEFALVEMNHEWDARAAITALNKSEQSGRVLSVRAARFRECHGR